MHAVCMVLLVRLVLVTRCGCCDGRCDYGDMDGPPGGVYYLYYSLCDPPLSSSVSSIASRLATPAVGRRRGVGGRKVGLSRVVRKNRFVLAHKLSAHTYRVGS